MTAADTASTRLGRLRSALAESPPLLWSFAYFFCLLSGYYVLRPVREAMAASSDIEAVFPPALIAFFAERGVALGEFTLQFIFKGEARIFLFLGFLLAVYSGLGLLPLGLIAAIVAIIYVQVSSNATPAVTNADDEEEF